MCVLTRWLMWCMASRSRHNCCSTSDSWSCTSRQRSSSSCAAASSLLVCWPCSMSFLASSLRQSLSSFISSWSKPSISRLMVSRRSLSTSSSSSASWVFCLPGCWVVPLACRPGDMADAAGNCDGAAAVPLWFSVDWLPLCSFANSVGPAGDFIVKVEGCCASLLLSLSATAGAESTRLGSFSAVLEGWPLVFAGSVIILATGAAPMVMG